MQAAGRMTGKGAACVPALHGHGHTILSNTATFACGRFACYELWWSTDQDCSKGLGSQAACIHNTYISIAGRGGDGPAQAASSYPPLQKGSVAVAWVFMVAWRHG